MRAVQTQIQRDAAVGGNAARLGGLFVTSAPHTCQQFVNIYGSLCGNQRLYVNMLRDIVGWVFSTSVFFLRYSFRFRYTLLIF